MIFGPDISLFSCDGTTAPKFATNYQACCLLIIIPKLNRGINPSLCSCSNLKAEPMTDIGVHEYFCVNACRPHFPD